MHVYDPESSSQSTDSQLLARARVGDYPAFEALVDRYAGLVYKFAWSLQQGPVVAETVVTVTFLRAIDELKDLPEGVTFRVWILSLAAHQARHSLR